MTNTIEFNLFNIKTLLNDSSGQRFHIGVKNVGRLFNVFFYILFFRVMVLHEFRTVIHCFECSTSLIILIVFIVIQITPTTTVLCTLFSDVFQLIIKFLQHLFQSLYSFVNGIVIQLGVILDVFQISLLETAHLFLHLFFEFVENLLFRLALVSQ